MKGYTFPYGLSTQKLNGYLKFNKINENLKNFCLHLTDYLNTKMYFAISMFVPMISGKCELYIYISFLQEFNHPHI